MKSIIFCLKFRDKDLSSCAFPTVVCDFCDRWNDTDRIHPKLHMHVAECVIKFIKCDEFASEKDLV